MRRKDQREGIFISVGVWGWALDGFVYHALLQVNNRYEVHQNYLGKDMETQWEFLLLDGSRSKEWKIL